MVFLHELTKQDLTAKESAISQLTSRMGDEIRDITCAYEEEKRQTEAMIGELTGQLKRGLTQALAKNKGLAEEVRAKDEEIERLRRMLRENFGGEGEEK